MAPPIIQFVDVTVNVGGAVADKFSFGTLMGVFEHDNKPDRQAGPYFSITEVNDAGFSASQAPEINAWASAVFAQDDGVDQILIGRRIPVGGGIAKFVWQVDDSSSTFVDVTTAFNDATSGDFEPFPTTEDVGDYCAIGFTEPFGQVIFDAAMGTAGVGGVVVWEYLSAPGVWTALSGVSDGTMNFTAGTSDGQTLTYTIPAGWPELLVNGVNGYWIRPRVTTVYTTNPVYDQGYVGSDANLTESLDAIEAAGEDTWYITTIGTRTDAEIAELRAWTDTRRKIAIVQSDDLTLVAALALQVANTNRVALLYYPDDTVYADGAWASSGGGMNLDITGGVGVWGFRTLEGIAFSNVTGAQATAIWSANANLYGRNKGLSFTSNGTFGSGRFMDVTTSSDWLVTRTEEAIIQLLVDSNGVPYTNAGITQVVGVVSGVLTQGVDFGHLSPDDPPRIIAPDVNEVSAADKTARTLKLTVEATLAGGIQKVVITINLTL